MSKKQEKADNQIHICVYCGKEILGEPVMTRTKRGINVYAHYECVFGRKRTKDVQEESNLISRH